MHLKLDLLEFRKVSSTDYYGDNRYQMKFEEFSNLGVPVIDAFMLISIYV